MTTKATISDEAVEAVKTAIRKALTDRLKNLDTGGEFDVDVLLRGCEHALHSRGYEHPSDAAEILASAAARAALEAACPHITPHGIGELRDRLSRANDVVSLERDARIAAEAKVAFLLDKFVPAYAAWMDDHDDDTETSIYRKGSTFGDLRKAWSALQRNPEGEVEPVVYVAQETLDRVKEYGNVWRGHLTAKSGEVALYLHPPRGQGTGDEALIEALREIEQAMDGDGPLAGGDDSYTVDAMGLRARAALSPKATKGDGV